MEQPTEQVARRLKKMGELLVWTWLVGVAGVTIVPVLASFVSMMLLKQEPSIVSEYMDAALRVQWPFGVGTVPVVIASVLLFRRAGRNLVVQAETKREARRRLESSIWGGVLWSLTGIVGAVIVWTGWEKIVAGMRGPTGPQAGVLILEVYFLGLLWLQRMTASAESVSRKTVMTVMWTLGLLMVLVLGIFTMGRN